MLSEKSGYVFEYMWHITFKKDPVHCPETTSCFCELFGYCDLNCPEEGWCKGRYWHPPFLTAFPEHWPEEGQGTNGWPTEGWWVEDVKNAERMRRTRLEI